MIARLIDFEAWANQRILAAVRALPPEKSERACMVFAHVANGLAVWYERVKGVELKSQPWTKLTLDECELALERQQSLWRAMLETERDMNRVISYRTMAGVPYENTLLDILQHLSFHSHYHRGQVNTAVREAGGTPVNVDYITFVREVPA